MTLPYQCLTACTRPGADGHGWLLFGATGSELVVQSSTGATSNWSPEIPTSEVKVRYESPNKDPEPALEDEHEGPPGKRVKLTPVVEPKPNILHLKTTQDGQHLVVVTAEDKCIRVFQIDDQCRLKQLSQR
ncbi:tRNA (guanine-N(7)-)-methyltransferase non-catalytic subunit trm82 [Paraconiothyrium brasiliense]|uniref:tRNA (Guanine-N(7)-)-methyltransferase non-catalytic subunit trm82 n=1 Tax=Paraconiothyrium brasiliense TaxID=300254 RepID=A0ABR3RHQ8_9PLEO